MSKTSLYQQLCQQAQLTPVKQRSAIQQFTSLQTLSEADLSQRITQGLHALLSLLDKPQQVPVDKALIDYYISKVDDILTEQLNQIIHSEVFRELESSWRSLNYLIDNTQSGRHSKIEVLDVSKSDLQEDFNDSHDITASGLYKHIYIDEYDTPGGEPIAAVITDYEFDSTSQDIQLLDQMAQLGSIAHCPMISRIGASFFHKPNMDDVLAIDDDESFFERAEFIKWNQFRQQDYARYVGLTLPKFLLRLPYGTDNPVKNFNYQEEIADPSRHMLWGSASFPFAINMMKSFYETGWTVNIRGSESGGRVENFPLHFYDDGQGLKSMIPTECLIPEAKELALSHLGFIPLCYYKHSDFGCFFSANSIQQPKSYHDKQAAANARINARLPYVLLVSRLGHYLKVLQRENIGSNKTPHELQRELNQWLQGLVTKMNHPTPDIIARHPLREGTVAVGPVLDNPGYYDVSLCVIPHFQVEGVDVQLSLMAQMPAQESY